MKIKGVYKWQLVNKETGEVEGRGSQENLITDSYLKDFQEPNRPKDKEYKYGRAVCSDQSVPLPALEFREYGVASANISRDVVGTGQSFVYDDAAGTRTFSTNFSPPVSPRTWTIFGADQQYRDSVGTYRWWDFVSFIVLTTPVTQLTTQFLYIEYEMYTYYSNGLLDSPINDYIKAFFNGEIYEQMKWLSVNESAARLAVTPFRPPVTLNNVGRRLGTTYEYNPPSNPIQNDGCRYGQTPQFTMATTESPGPVGIPVWLAPREGSSPYLSCTVGLFDNTDIVPSISRVYTHPNSRHWVVFSDPSYPPSSRASITPSGTPTNKAPIIIRLEVTKTGDASDIVDETFTANPATDELTVGQDDWAVDDIVQFTTTGTLPAPLATSTDYYVTVKSGTSPTVLLEVSLSEGGATVNITDAGSGTHTLSRQNTGRYRLTMQPSPRNVRSDNVINPACFYYQIFPMVDVNSVVMPNRDDSMYYPGYGVIGREGDYIYTVHYESTGNQLMICRQLMFTPECSVPLHSAFGTSGLTFYRVIRAKGTYSDMVYIATSVGIYSYDLSSPATPTLMSITGMLDSDVRELAFDEITEYLWAGHLVGMSRINLGTNVATQYDNGVGDPLAGLSDADIECRPGYLTAHNGFVFRTIGNSHRKWLLEDGVGYCTVNAYGRVAGGSTIRKSNGHLVWRGEYAWDVWNVTGITGPNTGTFNYVESYDPGISENTIQTTLMFELQDDRWRTVVWASSESRIETYTIGGDYRYRSIDGLTDVPSLSTSYDLEENVHAANGRNPIDISEGDMNLSLQIVRESLLGGSPRELYGWTGSAWEKENATDRQIIKTGTHSLGHGISVAFNNAVGENWDDQFVLGEFLTFMISPTLIKDNLQTYAIKARMYQCYVKRVDNWTTTIAANVTVPEAPTGSAPDADYRDLDFDPITLEVYNVTTATYMTQVVSPPGDEEYSVVGLLDGTFEFHANQIGDSVRISYNYTCYY